MVDVKEVLCTNAYLMGPKLVSLEDALHCADVIILGAPHTAYRNLHFLDDKVVVDLWGFSPTIDKSQEGEFSHQ